MVFARWAHKDQRGRVMGGDPCDSGRLPIRRPPRGYLLLGWSVFPPSQPHRGSLMPFNFGFCAPAQKPGISIVQEQSPPYPRGRLCRPRGSCPSVGVGGRGHRGRHRASRPGLPETRIGNPAETHPRPSAENPGSLPKDSPFTPAAAAGLRANGGYAEIIGDVPFMPRGRRGVEAWKIRFRHRASRTFAK